MLKDEGGDKTGVEVDDDEGVDGVANLSPAC